MKLSAIFRGIVTIAFFAGVSAAVAVTFTNPAQITIPDSPSPPTTAALYPSNIIVSGFGAGFTVSKVTVTINDFRHHFPDDVDMLLVGPSGQKMVIWSDVGGNATNTVGCVDADCTSSSAGVTITLDDAAAAALPDNTILSTGTFRPTAVAAGDIFPAPAPTGFVNAAPAGAATFANTFNGINPNGTWSLYVVDDNMSDTGKIVGGWSLAITMLAFYSACSRPAPITLRSSPKRCPTEADSSL